jgi:hypothetical protein
MQQAIVGFHLDEENIGLLISPVVIQHVRHDPPWQNRPWVLTEQGRKEKLGVMLECRSVSCYSQVEMSYLITK